MSIGLKFGMDRVVCPYCKNDILYRTSGEFEGYWEVHCESCERYFLLPDIYYMIEVR